LWGTGDSAKMPRKGTAVNLQHTIQNCLRWSQETRRSYDQVQGEATLETLRRFRWVALFLVPLHAALVWALSGYRAPADHPEMQVWAERIWTLHVAAGLAVVVAAALAWRLARADRASPGAVALQIAIGVGYLVLGGLLTAADLVANVGVGLSSYMLVSVMVGVLSLMRPAISVPLFVAAYMGFKALVAGLPIDVLHQDSLNILGLSIALMAMMASLMVWGQYARAVKLRRELSRSNAALVEKQEELAFLAEHDTLTGLLNRRAFMRLAQQELDRATRAQLATHCIMVDLDFFKRVNDTHGHPVGDAMLRHVAGLLHSGVRSTDTLARMGGEEFIVLLPHTSREGALAVAEKMRQLVRTHALQHQGQPLPVTASFGVSGTEPGQAAQADSIYAAADRALYVAKQLGRDRVEYAVPEVSELASLRA
jgi:diguanylate cyclase